MTGLMVLPNQEGYGRTPSRLVPSACLFPSPHLCWLPWLIPDQVSCVWIWSDDCFWCLLVQFWQYGGRSNHSSCKLAQSIVHLVSGTFTIEELSTAAAMLCSVLIFIQHKCCLKRPNHQSSTNFVCLTGRKEIIILLWSPVSTHNIK